MAKATKVVVPPIPQPTVYQLELTEKEAQLVKALVGRIVAGSYGSTSIYNALSDVGIYGGFDTEGAQNIRIRTK